MIPEEIRVHENNMVLKHRLYLSAVAALGKALTAAGAAAGVPRK